MSDVLFLAHRIPFPPDRGDKIRSFNILRGIGRHARVHLACFADDGADAAQLPALREAMEGSLGEAHVEVRRGTALGAARALACGRPLSLALFEGPALQDFVDRMLAQREIGTIFAFSAQMAQFVPADVGARFIMDFADMDSAKFAGYGAAGLGPRAWIYRREAGRLLAHERAVAQRADLSLFVSEAEAQLFREGTGLTANIAALENGVDLGFYDSAAAFPRLTPGQRGQGPLIVFTGQMDYRPNVEAVTSFAHDVMPLILREAPNARFAIVGRKPAAAVRRLDASRSTLVTGAVADVRSWLDAADVVVAPLTIARGVQNKVLEAMAMARPVVATSAAFEGIAAVAGRDLLVADGSDTQAAAVLRLLRDPAEAAAIAAAARRRMEAAYSWSARLAALPEMLGRPARRAA